MLEFVPKRSQNVIEFGCGSGNFSATLKKYMPHAKFTGVELMTKESQQAEKVLDHVYNTNIDNGLEFLANNKYDCAIFLDVLEHLKDPWTILENLHNHLEDGAKVVASIPNMRHLDVMKDLLIKGRFNYVEDGIMDRTHLRFFTQKTMVDLFTNSGYSVNQIKGISGDMPWKFGLLNSILMNKLNDMQFIQFGIIAERR